jgi:hypothetical protein
MSSTTRKRKRVHKRNTKQCDIKRCNLCYEDKNDAKSRCNTPKCAGNICNTCSDNMFKLIDICFDDSFCINCPFCRCACVIPPEYHSREMKQRFFKKSVDLLCVDCTDPECSLHTPIVRILTKYNYMVYLSDDNGNTLMHYAAEFRATGAMEHISLCGGSVTVPNDDGATPLQILGSHLFDQY